MKKSLIALAALATVATAAQAQSSVTLYGIVDVGYLHVSKTGATTSATSTGSLSTINTGNLSTSRWGMKGSEDLGGGLKANFTLEGEMDADTGAQNSVLFKRGSWVQLDQSGIGSLTLGRQNRLDYAAVASNDPWGTSNVGGFVSAGYLGGTAVGAAAIRPDNAVTLQSAKINGLSAAYQYGMGEVAGSADKGKVQSVNLDYTVGNFRANATYTQTNDTLNASASTKGQFYFASYNFGFIQANAGYIETTTAASGKLGIKNQVTLLGAKVPVNAKTNALVGYYDHKNANHTRDADGQIYSLGATYDLSKRTTLYALYAASNVDSANTVLAVSNTGSAATSGAHNQGHNAPKGLDQTVYAVGIRHSF